MASKSATGEGISGTVSIVDGTILWSYKNEVLATIELDDVAVIGEFTTVADAYLDDWFMVFVKKDRSFTEVPFYVNNRDVLIDFLNNNLATKPAFGALAGSIDWKSFVVYPGSLQGEPLFNVTLVDKPRAKQNFFTRLLYAIGLKKFTMVHQVDLSEPVLDFLKLAPGTT